jgi:caffeoyl-CoA O-methyltransferase
MSRSQQVQLDDRTLDYLLTASDPLPPGVEVALNRADQMGRSSMQVSEDQALLIRFQLRLIDAKTALEIGTFIGLSALIIADAMGPEGRLICLDRSEEWTSNARILWEESGVAERIDLRLGDAHETIRELEGTFDAVFIDADKPGYIDYLRRVTPLLRPGGLLLVDNTLWYGRVADPAVGDEDTRAIREFNRALVADPAFEVVMVGVADGLTLGRRI